MTAMDSRERVFSLFDGHPVDRPPVFASTLAGAAFMAGVPQGRFHQDPDVLADCVVKASQELHLDGVYVSSDNAVLHAALGGDVLFPEDDEPWAVGRLVKDWDDLKNLTVPDPLTATRTSTLLKAARRAVSIAGSALYVEANIDSGPFQLALTLRGAEQAMLDLQDEPLEFEALLDFCTEVVIGYGRSMAKTGVDGIQFGESSASLIGPSVFERLVLPRDTRVVKALQDAGVHAFLHVCGNANHLLELLGRTGADCLELDSLVDLEQAFKLLGPEVVLRGNVDTMLLLDGPVKEIQAAATACLEKARSAGGRIILSPGCGVPKLTPAEHIRSGLVDVACGLGTEKERPWSKQE